MGEKSGSLTYRKQLDSSFLSGNDNRVFLRTPEITLDAEGERKGWIKIKEVDYD